MIRFYHSADTVNFTIDAKIALDAISALDVNVALILSKIYFKDTKYTNIQWERVGGTSSAKER